MISIHPTRILGPWKMGYALDYQTVSSSFTGYNEFGRPRFDTKRTELGELIYRLKYGHDRSVTPAITAAAADFIIEGWKLSCGALIPVPPSQSRTEQPVHLLARSISEALSVPLLANTVAKIRPTPQLKSVYDYQKKKEILSGAFKVNEGQLIAQAVLLFDDVYQSGATMTSVAEAIAAARPGIQIYTFSITRTHKR